MKTILFILLLCLCVNEILAQNQNYQHVASLQSGVSLFSFFRGNLKGNLQDTTFRFESGKAHNFPQIQLAYDYGITPWLSVGGAVAFNQVTATLYNVTYERTQNLGNVNLNVSRLTVGARALFHYANSDRLDLYSGVRLGAGVWGVKVSSSIVDRQIDPLLRAAGGKGLWRRILGRDLGGGWALFHAQLIAFGLRGYVSERVGINGELAFGSPYFLSLGVNYRFGLTE